MLYSNKFKLLGANSNSSTMGIAQVAAATANPVLQVSPDRVVMLRSLFLEFDQPGVIDRFLVSTWDQNWSDQSWPDQSWPDQSWTTFKSTSSPNPATAATTPPDRRVVSGMTVIWVSNRFIRLGATA